MFTTKEKAVIYEAFDLYYKEYCKTLPTKEELSHVVIPDELEAKMQKLIAKERKFYYYWINTLGKRVAAIILAIILCLTTVTFSVRALREPVVRFIVETFEKFSNVIFVNDKSQDDINADLILEKMNPTYIPNGFMEEATFDDAMGYQVIYSNGTETIMYMQAINKEGVLQANTENVEYEEFNINGYDAIYYFNKGTNTIVISGEKYIFTFESTIEKDELTKMAESIEFE